MGHTSKLTLVAFILVTASGWLALAVCTEGSTLLPALAAGAVAALLVHVWVGRPLRRLRQQLVDRAAVAPAAMTSPQRILAEVARVLGRLLDERDELETGLLNQMQQSRQRLHGKDEVLANTVHELRTPLTSIIAAIDLMTSHHDDMSEEEHAEFLSQAKTAGQHMMFLVNDLLDTAAIEAGRITMEIERCSLERVLIETKRSMDMVAASRCIELAFPAVDPEIEVLADHARAMQVIFNLISNAVKYSPAGGKVTLALHVGAEAVTFEISDQGDGIPETMRTRLFTKFSRLHSGSEVQSSGIGLYLSKQLVELMNGTIGYREADSGGALFWFTLPRCLPAAVDVPLEAAPADM